MNHFEYVSKSKYMPVKKELIKIINQVQDELREQFTFDYKFIGSSSRNMLLMIRKQIKDMTLISILK